MIKAADLRLNNAVLYERGMWQVEEICSTTVRLSHQEGNISVTDIDPIPLDASILEKCGFVSNKKETIFMLGDLGISMRNPKMILCYWGDTCLCRNEKYSLHQLQNLYHSLVGKELNVNL